MSYAVGDMGTFAFDDGVMPVLVISVEDEDGYTEVEFITSDGYPDYFKVGDEYEPRFVASGVNVFNM